MNAGYEELLPIVRDTPTWNWVDNSSKSWSPFPIFVWTFQFWPHVVDFHLLLLKFARFFFVSFVPIIFVFCFGYDLLSVTLGLVSLVCIRFSLSAESPNSSWLFFSRVVPTSRASAQHDLWLWPALQREDVRSWFDISRQSWIGVSNRSNSPYIAYTKIVTWVKKILLEGVSRMVTNDAYSSSGFERENEKSCEPLPNLSSRNEGMVSV